MLNVGDILTGRYRIDALLGAGGMGAVYRAYDSFRKRQVAVKEFLLGNLPSINDVRGAENTLLKNGSKPLFREQALEQFRREAELLSQLNHPNIPEVYDFFILGDQGYIVMALLEGKDLRVIQEENQGPLAEKQVIGWMGQILDALEYCHARQVIHRDLKPENILLTDSGQIFLVDFGIAKSMSTQSSNLTTVGARALSPGYSPPEQYAGAGGTDQRSDIYSLGAVCYFLLTGTDPTESTMRQAGDELRNPGKVNPAVSKEMESVILRCMALSKADRPQTAGDIRKMMMASAGGTSETGEDGKGKKKDRSCLWMTISAIIILVLAIIGVISIIKGFTNNKQAPTVSPVVTQPASESTETGLLATVPARTTELQPSPTIPLPTALPKTATPTRDPMVPPDCTSIGQEWVSPVDGQTLVCVPAGTFSMGGPDCFYDTCLHAVSLDSYWIDKTEVTNQQFVQFLLNHLADIRKDGEEIYYKDLADPIFTTHNFGMPLRILGTGSDIRSDSQVADHPVYGVSWYGAQIYCESVGRQLPSEAEWEMAARGTESLKYPWGNEFDCAKVNLNENQSLEACDMYLSQNVSATSPVGAFPAGASPYGALDMLGNVSEWVNDWYDVSYYGNSPLSNPSGPETGIEKIRRGWDGFPLEEMIYRRMNIGPDDILNLGGFRCAYSPTDTQP